MTTKNINGREVVFVEVPAEAINFKISGTGYPCYLSFSWHVAEPVNLTRSHKIIGKASSLSEEQWAGIVRELPIGRRFENYCGDFPIWYHTPTQSGLSLLSSLGMKPGTTLLLIKEK